MTGLKKVIESKAKIRFPDCDPFNHLNNAKYIDYMINAREDQLLEHYGFDLCKLACEKGLGWVTAQTQISYIKPALLMDIVTIQTRVLSVTDKTVLLEALMWNENKSAVKAIMWMKLVHYNLWQRKSHPHSADLMDFFQQLTAPIPAVMTFEDRVHQLKGL
jgi:acyl-CoA thioester hydrolase